NLMNLKHAVTDVGLVSDLADVYGVTLVILITTILLILIYGNPMSKPSIIHKLLGSSFHRSAVDLTEKKFYKMAWQIIKVDFMAAVNRLHLIRSYNILPQDLDAILATLVKSVCLPLTLGGLGVPNLEEAINDSNWIVWRRGDEMGSVV
ncbi:hypothetical protein ACJX0J_024553, partial [Zea mays]